MGKDNFVNITEDMIYAEDKKLPLCGWVGTHYTANCAENVMSLDYSLIDCESPIEQTLSMAFHVLGLSNFSSFTSGMIDVVSIKNQDEITSNGNVYRSDFMITVDYSLPNGIECARFVVECDGHDYHEKTKSQVVRDNKRSRDLLADGYIVVRFSGSEIHRSPYDCVKDLMRIISNYYFRRV